MPDSHWVPAPSDRFVLFDKNDEPVGTVIGFNTEVRKLILVIEDGVPEKHYMGLGEHIAYRPLEG